MRDALAAVSDGALEVDHGVAPWFGLHEPHPAPRREATSAGRQDIEHQPVRTRRAACSSAAWTKALATPRCRQAGRTKQR